MTLSACAPDDSPVTVDWGPPITAPALIVHAGTPLDALATGAVCSASIVERVVITAEHCLRGTLEVIVLAAPECEPAGAQRLALGAPYDLADRGDLAILPVTSADTSDWASLGSDGTAVLGWATVQKSGIKTCGLHATPVTVLTPDQCSHITAADTREAAGPAMICAEANGQDVCSGDSGGPLIDSEGRIGGVLSRGHGCSVNGRSIYTPVCPALDDVTPGLCAGARSLE